MNYQKFIVAGNVGNAPEMRYLPDGTAVSNFSLAVNNKYNDRNGLPVTETTWFRVSVFGRQAENCNQYLAKGQQVLVEGTLKADPATGGPRTFVRSDGTVGASFEIRAFAVQFGSRNGSTGSPSDDGDYAGSADEDDEIPF